MVALVGMLAFAGFVLVEKRNVASEMQNLNELAGLGPVVSALAHALQRERGASAGLIGSTGRMFAHKLSAQRERTDENRTILAEAFEDFDAIAYGADIAGKIETARDALAHLEDWRDRVTELSLTVPEMANYYTGTIANLLNVVQEMATLSTNSEATNAIAAYTMFLQAKERAGLERAMGSTGFSAGGFAPSIYRRFVQLIAMQEAFLGIFRSYATGEQKAFYDNTVVGEAVEEVDRMRKIAIETIATGNTGGIEGGYWFDAMTRKIDLLKEVEDRIAGDLQALAGTRRSEALANVYQVAALTGVLLLIMLALVHAIFENRRADATLRASEEKFRNLFEHANDGILIIDPTTRRLLDANVSALERLGFTRDELLELTIDALVPGDADLRPEEIIRQMLDCGGFVFERVYLRKDGSELPVEVSARVVEHGDRTVIQSFVRDITERKQAEEQLRQAHKMEAVGQLTGGVAHDFNNLLAIILGNAELLNERLGNDALAETVIRAANRGGELTQRLLAFSRRQPLRPNATDLNALVAGSTDLLRRTLGEPVAIGTEAARDLWNVEIDPNQLENALLNLAINARDAMPDGGTLVIETANVTLGDRAAAAIGAVPGDYAMLAVTDTGTGMPPEVLEHVFEPFFTTKKVGEGSGLGLSMAYGFAKQSGGALQIESELGDGTTVRMYLPRAKGLDVAATEPARSSGSATRAAETCWWWRTMPTFAVSRSRFWRSWDMTPRRPRTGLRRLPCSTTTSTSTFCSPTS